MTTKRTALSILTAVAVVPVTIGAFAGVSGIATGATTSHHATPVAHAATRHPAVTASASPVAERKHRSTGRPVLRVEDTTNQPTQRRIRLFEAYSSCLLHHGAAPATSGMSPDLTFSGHGTLVQQPVPAAATAACSDVEPASPPALDAATNPDFAAQAATYVACLGRHGEQVHLLNDHDLSWTWDADQDPAAIPDDGGRTEDACLVAAFG